ncbi:hypothetical protein JKP88DRAFT_352453 [Tribonema minus]|uniref:Uncharacterized protein n=1 Tax=Tribonema minus TaxID=303371 RepID=A0A836CMT8_9STRA|nr:hypothetical protein JKP88DRAFT_352453 [Tribonema minus]
MTFLNEPMYSTTASFDGLSWQLAVKRAIGVEEQTAGCKLCGKAPGGTLHARLCQAPHGKAHDTIVHNSVKRATQRILRQYLKTGLVDEDYTPFLGSAGPPESRRMDIVLPADTFPVTGYDDPTRHLPLMVDVTCFEAQVASRAAKTAADPERCCRDQEAAKSTHYSGHYDQNCYKLATLAIGSFGSIGEQGWKLLEAVATEYASRMSVPGGARPKALKGIALARLRLALSAALHIASSADTRTSDDQTQLMRYECVIFYLKHAVSAAGPVFLCSDHSTADGKQPCFTALAQVQAQQADHIADAAAGAPIVPGNGGMLGSFAMNAGYTLKQGTMSGQRGGLASSSSLDLT